VVLEAEVDLPPVGREAGLGRVAVERSGEQARLSPGAADHRDLLLVVVHDLRSGGGDVREQAPHRVPHRGAVGARVAGQAHRLALCLLVVADRHEPQVGVVVRVGLLGTVGHEGDLAAGRRPGRLAVVVVAERDLPGLPASQVQDVQVGTPVIEIAAPVLLELEPVDHPGVGRTLLLLLLLLLLAGLGIADHQHQPPAIGRPLEAPHPLGHLGEPARVAAPQVEQPDLVLALLRPRLRRGVHAIRQERQAVAVRAEARVGRRRAGAGEREGLAARVCDHEQPGLGLVLGEVVPLDGEDDQGPVRAESRLPHIRQGEVVVDAQRSPLAGGSGRQRAARSPHAQKPQPDRQPP